MTSRRLRPRPPGPGSRPISRPAASTSVERRARRIARASQRPRSACGLGGRGAGPRRARAMRPRVPRAPASSGARCGTRPARAAERAESHPDGVGVPADERRRAPAWSPAGAASASAANRRARVGAATGRRPREAAGAPSQPPCEDSRTGSAALRSCISQRSRGKIARLVSMRPCRTSRRHRGVPVRGSRDVASRRTARAAGLEGVDPGRGARRRCSASSSSACSPTGPTWPHPPVPARVVDPSGDVLFTGDDISRGPEGVPAQRPDGVRLDLRPRRLPRPRLHRRLPAPRRATSCASRTAAPRRTRAAQQDDRGLPGQPLRRATRARCTFTAPQARGVPRSSCRYYSGFFSDPTTEHGLRPNAITDPTQLRQLTAFFAWTAWAAAARPARPQLLVHEQLAARAAGRQQADART